MTGNRTKDHIVPTHRVIRMADEAGDIVRGDDGFAVFWPTKNQGAFTAWHLRLLADELDRRNAAWQERIELEIGCDQG